jgi:hypothetical protein
MKGYHCSSRRIWPARRDYPTVPASKQLARWANGSLAQQKSSPLILVDEAKTLPAVKAFIHITGYASSMMFTSFLWRV